MNERVTIDRMGYGPEAVGRLESGKAVFVEGGAPEDVAEVAITQEKASFARGRLASLENPSPLRTPPRCPFGAYAFDRPDDTRCGGCPWEHLGYEAQLQAKRANVVSALVRTARMEAARAEALVAPCAPSKREWGYRNKIEMGAHWAEGPGTRQGTFELGFHATSSNNLVPITSCPLAYKAIEGAPKALRGALRYLQGSESLDIFRVGVRHSVRTKQTELAIWTPPSPFPRAQVVSMLQKPLRATSIVRVIADPGKARKVKRVENLHGKGHWEEEVGSARFMVSAPSFFQVNTAQAERLTAEVLQFLGGSFDDKQPAGLEGLYIADLYAGVGTFSIPLAQAGADVVAVESAGSSVRDLRRNADANRVDVEVVGGDAARELRELGELDALVVDPPRAGLADGVVEDIAAARPERVAYISCDPATWARDVARFEHSGYRLAQVQPVDLFPQTYHVEVASLFERLP